MPLLETNNLFKLLCMFLVLYFLHVTSIEKLSYYTSVHAIIISFYCVSDTVIVARDYEVEWL